jgi:hypothetical protein
MPSLRTRFSRAFSAFISNEIGETTAETIPCAQTAIGCFILEIGKGGTGLLNEPQDPASLVKKHIGLDRSTQSVFQASNDIEEVEVLAALLAGRANVGGPEPRYGIRFLTGDFIDLPIEVKHTPEYGDTGVQAVDRRHFDLESDAEGYTLLMRRLVERLQAGEHRIRLAGTHQIALMLRAFSGLGDSEISAEKKARCYKLLKNYRSL